MSPRASHVVEYRSTDNAGNAGGDQVGRVLDRRRGSGRADRRGLRRPVDRAPRRCWCSSRPPAWTRRTARSIYEWDFGDGGGSFNQSPAAHVHEAGHLHGDGDGDRPAGQDRHRHRRGRGHRSRQPGAGGEGASPTPRSGDGAARRRSSARRRPIPTATRDDIMYLWDFGDGGANAFGRNVAVHVPDAGHLHGDGDGDRPRRRVRHRRGRDRRSATRRATCRRPCRRRRRRGPARRRCG